jgi:hypothetical protein
MIVEKYQNHHLMKIQKPLPTNIKTSFPDVSNILVTAPDCVKVVKSISLYLFKALASKPLHSLYNNIQS